MEQATTAGWRVPIVVFAMILAAAALWVTVSNARNSGSSGNTPTPAQVGGPSSFFGVADAQDSRRSGDEENCPGKRGQTPRGSGSDTAAQV